ncbi:MAG: hypothetical protein AAGF77_02890 [Bacteroidota bacterium]
MQLNLLFFIRILMRHAGLLFGVPIILATMVFFLTKGQPSVYDSKARIYTAFASGSTIELDNTKFDYSKTNIAYDNLLNLIRSRTTIEEVSLKLLAQHMMLDGPNKRIISREKYEQLMEIVPSEIKDLVVADDLTATYENFKAYKEADHNNFINELLNLEHPDYSINEILSKITVRRISISDFVDVGYQSEDPGICQNTLLILTETFIAANAQIKANQSDAVVQYFENQLNLTTKRLNDAESELLEFNKGNKIMNYYEQTKQLAMRRENFELRYQEVAQRHNASKAVIPRLEKKMGAYLQKKINNKQVLSVRDAISKINYQIGLKDLKLSRDSLQQKENEQSIVKLKEKLFDLKDQLKHAIDSVYTIDHDKHGVASSNILNEWLDNTITYEGSKSELAILDQMRIEFDELYTWYAPLGATMKKLERKINIEEQEYLSLLHSLGLAKLRQQNSQLQANLKISEVPFFPIKPNPSKRMLLVIVAGVVGFILVAMTVLVLEFLDGNLNTAQRAKDKIGLKVSSIFPAIVEKNKSIDYRYLKNKAVTAISRDIILKQFQKSDNGMPQINLIFSTQEGEGKSYICDLLVHKFCELGYMTLHITYDSKDFGANINCYQQLKYEVDDKLYTISTIEEFDVFNAITDYSIFDFILLEIPGIIRNPFPVKLASVMDYSFLVTRANRAWSEADKNALKLFTEATTGPEPSVILNGVKVLEMETVVGDLPKKRSLLRRFIKRCVQLRFFTKKSILR